MGRPLSHYLPQGFAEAVLEQLQEGVLITEAELDPPGPRILWVNSAWERITGHSAEQAVNATPAILQGPETWRETLDRIRADLEAIGSTEAEAINYRPDGTPFRMAMTISPVRNEDGEITHFAAIQRNITRDKVESSLLRQLEGLTRIQREVALGDLDLEKMRQRVADMALEITGADGAAVEEVEREEIIYRAVAGTARDHADLRLPLDQTLSGRVFREKTPQYCRDIEVDSRVSMKEEARRVGFISGILVPLSHKDRVFGVLKVFAGEADRFSKEHLQLLRVASEVLAAGIAKASDYTAEVERRTMLLDAIPAMISYVDNEHRYQEVNAAYEKLFQRAARTIRGKHVRELLGEEGYDRVRPYIEAALRGERVSYERDVPLGQSGVRLLQGDYFPHFGPEGSVRGLYAVVRDITEAPSARTDYLTGLANRRQFDNEGARHIELSRRHEEPITLIMLDLDRFKVVNDTYGHGTGDEVLKDIAALMSRICRKSDLAGRWGGEEFVILLPKTEVKNGVEIAERLRAEVEAHTFPEGGSVTISLGVASATTEDSLQDLVHRADSLLSKAKQGGRNRVEMNTGK